MCVCVCVCVCVVPAWTGASRMCAWRLVGFPCSFPGGTHLPIGRVSGGNVAFSVDGKIGNTPNTQRPLPSPNNRTPPPRFFVSPFPSFPHMFSHHHPTTLPDDAQQGGLRPSRTRGGKRQLPSLRMPGGGGSRRRRVPGGQGSPGTAGPESGGAAARASRRMLLERLKGLEESVVR